jgi:hypothetical protein
MRSRKSRDSGAGMTSPPTHQNRLPRISILDSAQPKSALGLYLWRQWQNGTNRFQELRLRGLPKLHAAVAAGSSTRF